MAHNPQKQQAPSSKDDAARAPANGHAARPVPVPARSAPVPLQKGVAMPRPRGPSGIAQDEEFSLANYARLAPPWMVSAVIHMLVLILLGLIFFTTQMEPFQILSMPNPWAEELGDKLAEDTMSLETPETDYKFVTPQHLPQVADPFSAPAKLDVELTGSQFSTPQAIVAPAIGNALLGRDEGSRAALLKRFGGDKTTEEAVKLALQWLARQQLEDGSWSLSGPFSEGVLPSEHTSATAMALLAFQGAGFTHKQGTTQYKQLVAKGKDWLLDRQLENGSWRVDGGHHRMYTHGQCTIALCELYAMTQDSTLRKPAEKAVKYCVETQSPGPQGGGWRYNPADQDSDVSVTGWILMGLQSAKMAGLEVPADTLKRIGAFLDRCTADGSHYSYLAGGDPLHSMTAEALLCRQYLGWPRDSKKMAAGTKYLLERLPKWERYDDFSGRGTDVYYWYYATQMLHHLEGPAWEKWNAAMKPTLVNSQRKTGRERGSWDPQGDHWGPYGGRLYVTCLCTYMLEVYYRHLPLYSSVKLQ